MSNIPTSIKIVSILIILLAVAVMVVGVVMITQIPTFGLTVIAGGISGILMAMGLRRGRLRILSVAYVTSLLVIIIAMFAYSEGMGSTMVIAVPGIVLYLVVLRLLFGASAKEFFFMESGKTPTVKEMMETLRNWRDRKKPEPAKAEPVEQDSGPRKTTVTTVPTEPMGKPTEQNRVEQPEGAVETITEMVTWKDVIGFDRSDVPKPAPTPDGKPEEPRPVPVSQPRPVDTNQPATDTGGPEEFRYCIDCGFDLTRVPRAAKHCPRCGREIMWGDGQ